MREIRTSGLTRGSNGIGASRPLLSTLLVKNSNLPEWSGSGEFRGRVDRFFAAETVLKPQIARCEMPLSLNHAFRL
jgi:hypothetical protein